MKNKKSKSTSEPITHLPVLMHIETESNGPSPIPNDGTFIEDTDPKDGFASINTVRYGEEIDVDDM